MATKLPFLKLPEISLFKPRDAFAVDMGSASIKVLYLKRAGNAYAIERWGIIPLQDVGAELSPQDRRNITITRIAEFMAREKFPVKNIITSISGSQVIVRYVRFAKLSREELGKTIQFEAEPYIPFDIQDVDLSFHIIGDVVEDGQKKMDTILVAAKKEAVQTRLELLNEAHLRTVVIDVDGFALSNAYALSLDPAVQETALIVNIGAGTTTISIVENRQARVIRDVFIAGSHFTKAVQRTMACDLKTAEDMKLRYGLLVTTEEKEKNLAENQKEALQVSSALTTATKDLLLEIHKSIDFYVSQNPERSINRVLICGGSALMKNLDAYLRAELKLPVEVFNPLKSVAGAADIPLETAAQFAVATGLALRRENDIPKK